MAIVMSARSSLYAKACQCLSDTGQMIKMYLDFLEFLPDQTNFCLTCPAVLWILCRLLHIWFGAKNNKKYPKLSLYLELASMVHSRS